MLQQENTQPTKKTCSEDQYDINIPLMMIDILEAGNIFGEIGVLTKLRRTTTVIARETCVFQTLNLDALILIEKKFPSIFHKMKDSMSDYQDEEMFMRRQFVANIPYFRGLNEKSLSKIVLLMEPKTFESGDLITGAHDYSESISILWNGYIQVRAYRKDE